MSLNNSNSRIRAGLSQISVILLPFFSFDPRSLILDPRSPILDPRSPILDPAFPGNPDVYITTTNDKRRSYPDTLISESMVSFADSPF